MKNNQRGSRNHHKQTLVRYLCLWNLTIKCLDSVDKLLTHETSRFPSFSNKSTYMRACGAVSYYISYYTFMLFMICVDVIFFKAFSQRFNGTLCWVYDLNLCCPLHSDCIWGSKATISALTLWKVCVKSYQPHLSSSVSHWTVRCSRALAPANERQINQTQNWTRVSTETSVCVCVCVWTFGCAWDSGAH